MSSPVLASVVEGHGEVGAVPILLRRIAAEHYGRIDCTVPSPHRVKRGQMISSDFLDRAVRTQMARVGSAGGVLILLDADDDCPVHLAASLRGRLPDPRVEVVVAVREFEAWFLAAAESLRGHRDVRHDPAFDGDPQRHRDAKSRLTAMMTSHYRESLHQAPFTARMDL